MGHRGRLLGVIVIVAVLAAALIVARAQRPIPGTAAAIPVAGPPSVGTCVTDTTRITPENLYGGWDFSPAERTTTSTPVYPEVGFGSCAASHFGEVVDVNPQPDEVTVTVAGDSTSIEDPNSDRCFAAAAVALGVHTGAPTPGQIWSRDLAVPWLLVGPSKRQLEAGEHWAACLTVVVDKTGQSLAAYRGTLRDAIDTGAQRDLLGTCSNGGDTGYALQACASLHSQETVAEGGTDRPVSRGDLMTSCVAEARRATGLSALPHIPGLALVVEAYDSPSSDTPSTLTETDPVPAGASLSCEIRTTGTAKLKGSLIAVGNGPIPWG